MISTTPKQTLRFIFQHFMNSLHFFSFLCRLSISEEKALHTAKAYERVVHPLLYIKKDKDQWIY
ncbi:MAG: hypothetical protein ABFR82_12705 [Nitrospirota bacterium]